MYEPVGVVCHLIVDGQEQEFVVTARVLCDKVMHGLRRLVKDNKKEEIRQTMTLLADMRKDMLPADFQALHAKTMEQLSQRMIDAGRATEEEALEIVSSREGCAVAMHFGVEGAPALERCREIFELDSNRFLFMEALAEAKGEEQEALKNSSRRNPPQASAKS